MSLKDSILSISKSFVDYPTEVSHDVMCFIEEQINKTASLVPKEKIN